MTYVVKNNKSIDVNNLTFEQFHQIIQKYKSSYEIPNKIFGNGTIQIGEFKTFKETSMFPIPNNMCICKTNRWFKHYQSPKSRYLLLYDSRRNDSKRYVIAILEHGEVSYADLYGNEFGSSFRDEGKTNEEQRAFNEYQQSIGKDVVSLLYNLAADTSNIIDDNNQIQTENKQYNKNRNMKRTIRLTESELKQMIAESVKRVLSENTFNNCHSYQIVSYLIDPSADWQKNTLSSDEYEVSKRDFELLSHSAGNLNKQVMNIFRKYQINSGAVEEHNSEEPFIMDIDGDNFIS